MRFIVAMGMLLVAFLTGVWYTGAQTGVGFNAVSGFNKVATLFNGGLALIVVAIAVFAVLGLIAWFGRNNHYSKREIGLIAALIASLLLAAAGFNLWAFAWSGIWSRATMTAIIALSTCAIGALIINSIDGPRSNENERKVSDHA